jgi:hypothetical protein
LARGVVVNTATKISNLVHTTRFWNNIFQAQYQTIGKTNNSKVVGSKKNKKIKRGQENSAKDTCTLGKKILILIKNT